MNTEFDVAFVLLEDKSESQKYTLLYGSDLSFDVDGSMLHVMNDGKSIGVFPCNQWVIATISKKETPRTIHEKR